MSKSAPAAPDYGAAAAAQADSSREVTEQQTWANRPTINTPFGQQTWSTTPQWDPSTGQYLNTWTQNTNLTPEAQKALDSQMDITQGRSDLAKGLLGRTQEEYGQPMDWSNFEDMGANPDVPNYTPEQIQRGLDTNGMQNVDSSDKYYNQAGDAIFNQWKDRNEPQFGKDTDALRTQLYNQGLKEGDAAYDQAMQKQRESQTDARNQASYDATIGAGQEASRMYGMDSSLRGQQFGERQAQGAFANSAASQAMNQQLGIGQQQYGQKMQGANYQNQLRQQQIAETLQKRGFSLNEINSILSGQQISMPNMPSFNTANRSEGQQSLQAADMQGQHDLDVFNAQQAATQGLMSGVGGAMMFSDRRLKKNVEYIRDDIMTGLPAYMFHYVWEDDSIPKHYGFMADEVEKKFPDAVIEFHGYKAVNYGRLF
jgi:DNA-binding transcriptional MerR regulator